MAFWFGLRLTFCEQDENASMSVVALMPTQRDHSSRARSQARSAEGPGDGGMSILPLAAKNCFDRRARTRGGGMRRRGGSLPPVGLTPSLRQATPRTDN